MKKNSLISKKILAALLLGSVFCTPCVLAKDVNVSAGEEITETIYGGTAGSGNTLNVTLGANSVVLQIIGGFIENGEASNNVVTISGSGTINCPDIDNMHFSAAAGLANSKGDASNNILNVKGGTFTSDIFAGGAVDGNAKNNKIEITGGIFTDNVAGAYCGTGTAEGNSVVINGGTFIVESHDMDIAGANCDETDTATFTGNSVTINGGTFPTEGDHELNIYGAQGGQGNVTGNKVNINTVTITADNIFGAASYNGNLSANKVMINNSNVNAKIYGGYSVENGDVSNNEVNISGSGTIGTYEITDIVGGASEKGKATENKVNIISTGNLTVEADNISGGSTEEGGGNAEKNIVTISGNNIEIKGKIKGAETDTGSTNYNEVHLTGIKVHKRIVGGDSDGNEANYNKVVIDGGTYDKTLSGGDSDNAIIGGQTRKDAKGNSVEIKNASVAIRIYGGFNEEGTTGTVSGNSVVIKNTSIAADYNVYGGYADNNVSVLANIVELDNVTFAGNNKVYASGKNGVTEISATDGTITVGTNGLVANGALELGATDVVLKGNITGAGAVTVKAFTLDADKSVFLNSDLSVKSNNIDITNVSKELKLQFNGTEYTATQHKTAKEGLLGGTSSTILSFVNGNLKLEANEVLAVSGTVSGSDITLSGVQPTVYTKGSGDEIEEVGAQKSKTVGVIKEGTTELQSVAKVTVGTESNITAQDLQIKSVAGGGVLEIEVKGGSKLNLIGGDAGIVKNESGEAVKTSISVDTDSAVNIGDSEGEATDKKAEIGTLTVGGEVGVYNIGLNIDTLTMDGGSVVFDPAYIYVNELDFSGDGTFKVVADGTVVNVGMDKAELKAALDAAGLTTGATANNGYTVQDGKGVLAIKDTVDLSGADKHIIIDKAGTTTDKALQLGDGAVLVAKKAKGEEKTVSIKVASKDVVKISNKAQLVVSAEQYQKDGEFLKYAVVGDGSVSFDDLWTEENIFAADPTYKLVYKDGYLTADWNTVTGIYGDEIAAPTMYDRILQKESGSEANKFLKNIINATAGAGSTKASRAAGAKALNAVTSMGELAGVNHGIYTMSNQMTDAVAQHFSLLDEEDKQHDIWATYIHNKETVDGMKLGGIDATYDAKYNGIVVGADLLQNEKMMAGIALTYADGNIDGATGKVHTRNDAEYYGASVYGKFTNGNTALLGDISYMHGKGDITQHNNGTEITAEPKNDAFSIGVRAEQNIKAGVGSLVPYIGMRYLSIGTGNYENSLRMQYDIDKQNLFLMPVGLAYRANIQKDNWTYKPFIESGYVFNMGNKNIDQKVTYNGFGDTFGMDVVDRGYWFGRVGIEASGRKMSYGLGYQYMKSGNVKNNKYMVNVTWKF